MRDGAAGSGHAGGGVAASGDSGCVPDNPFAASMQRGGATRSIGRGLAKVEPGETLVAYTAKDGTAKDDGIGGSRNSPYTRALLRYLEEPGLDVGRMFRRVRDAVVTTTGGRQEPFLYGSLPGRRDVYLASAAPDGGTAGDTTSSSASPSPSPSAGDAAGAYREAKEIHTVVAYRVVVRRFPDSVEAELAQAQIDKLEGALVVAGATAVETWMKCRRRFPTLQRGRRVWTLSRFQTRASPKDTSFATRTCFAGSWPMADASKST